MKCRLISHHTQAGNYYGHRFVVEDGALVADIDPELVPSEVAAGRVEVIEKPAETEQTDKPERSRKK